MKHPAELPWRLYWFRSWRYWPRMFLDSLIKQSVETSGPRFTKTELQLESASFSMFSGSGMLKGLVLGNPEGYGTDFAVKVAQTEIGVRPGSLLADKIHITHVRVLNPQIHFEGGLVKNNLSQILDNVRAATGAGREPTTSSGTTKKLQVDEFTVTGGRIHVTAGLPGGPPFTVALPDIRFTHLGEGPEGIMAAELAGKLVDELYRYALNAVQTRLG